MRPVIDDGLQFELDSGLIYLNHAAVSPWPRCTIEAIQSFADENRRFGAKHYPDWVETESELRALLQRLINASSADDIALLKNTSEGLSLIAHGLTWQTGDNIVSIAQEFPSNRMVWESLAGQGVELRLVDLNQTDKPEQDLISLCDHRTRLITVSSVQYASGLHLSLPIIGEFCSANDILFCVDAIQSLGAVPFDLTDCKADFVVADGHKWMLGPEGLALFYCQPEARDQIQLHQFGWHMAEHAGNFDQIDWQPATSARRFECGSPNMLGVHALHASLTLIESIGVDQIHRKLLELTQAGIDRIDQLSLELISPRADARRAGILTFRIPGRDSNKLHATLNKEDVVCANRGGGIRFSPHYYNSIDQMNEAFDRLLSLI